MTWVLSGTLIFSIQNNANKVDPTDERAFGRYNESYEMNSVHQFGNFYGDADKTITVDWEFQMIWDGLRLSVRSVPRVMDPKLLKQQMAVFNAQVIKNLWRDPTVKFDEMVVQLKLRNKRTAAICADDISEVLKLIQIAQSLPVSTAEV